MQIKNSVILVTGGSSGLGKSTAKLLVKLGAQVIITGRDPKKLSEVANQIGAHPIHANADSDLDIQKTFSEIQSKFGKLDVLINNAGIGIHVPFEEITRNDYEKIFQTNVFGVAMMCKEAVKMFDQQGKGHIINIASTSSLSGYKTGSVYASSKFALRGLTQCLQAELRPRNIRVMQINPSEVPTAFGQEDRVERDEDPKKISSLEIAHSIVSVLSMDDRGMIPELTVWATNPW